MGLFGVLRLWFRNYFKLKFSLWEILHWSRIYFQNFQTWAPNSRFFQVGGFFSDFQYFGVIKSTFLIFLNYFWKFWAQIFDQWRIWAQKCILLFEFYRINWKLANFGFLSIYWNSGIFRFFTNNRQNSKRIVHFPAQILH